jgi:hypothetical protein
MERVVTAGLVVELDDDRRSASVPAIASIATHSDVT